MTTEQQEKITLYFVEVGVLLNKKCEDFVDYSQAYDCEHAFYDENFVLFLDSASATEYALAYVVKGVNRTYAIAKQLSIPKEWLDEKDIQSIKECGIFDEWDEVLMDERLSTKNIILDIYKSSEGTIKYNFIKGKEKL